MNTLLDDMNWRYATKKYDASRKIPEAQLQLLKDAIRFSPSSMGLQPYKVFVVEDAEVRRKLAEFSLLNKQSVLDASHLFVFAHITDFNEENVNEVVANIGLSRGLPAEVLEPIREKMTSAVLSRPTEAKNIWMAKQTYIALANLLNAAASLKIDATPMEGFQADRYNEILGLDALHLNAAVIATVGYRHPDDATQHLKKVRKPENELFITI